MRPLLLGSMTGVSPPSVGGLFCSLSCFSLSASFFGSTIGSDLVPPRRYLLSFGVTPLSLSSVMIWRILPVDLSARALERNCESALLSWDFTEAAGCALPDRLVLIELPDVPKTVLCA